MSAARTVLHLDLDAFFCAVEETRDPTLRGTRFAVGGTPGERGVVASCSYPARVFGVRSAMPMAQAIKMCPGLLVISGHYEAYEEASDAVMDRLRAASPMVEQVSIDEAFADITHVGEDTERLVRRLQSCIRDELGLPCSAGVASNKLVAKIATEVGKGSALKGVPPNALTVVPAGREAAFLAPLPIRMLWGVGPKTEERLARWRIMTIGDLALRSPDELAEVLGQYGRDLHAYAHGRDEAPLTTTHDVKSISQEVTFPRDVVDTDHLRRTIRELADMVGRRLRKAHLAGAVVRIKLRWSDFSTITRQIGMPAPVDGDDEIGATALSLLAKARPSLRPVRLIGVGVSGLVPRVHQLTLWEETPEQDATLQRTVDAVRDRFGSEALQRGSSLRHRQK